MKKFLINVPLLFLVLCADVIMAQSYLYELGVWKQRSLSADIMMEGLFRGQESELRSGIREELMTSRFNGDFELNSKTIIWHPSFLELDLGIQYNPTLRNEEFLVLPNRSETQTAEQYHLNAIIFNQRPLFFNIYGNQSRLFINREFATNVESNRRDLGALLSYRNGFLPFSVQVNRSRWKQQEKRTSRVFDNSRSGLCFTAHESFGNSDDHRITYTYEDISRTYAAVRSIRNFMHSARLQNSLRFGKKDADYFRSLVWLNNQIGSNELARIQVNETISVGLPSDFRAHGRYFYNFFDDNRITTIQHQGAYGIEHQLYRSLRSFLNQEYTFLDHSSYEDRILETEAGFAYNKNIPSGILAVNYRYKLRRDERDSPSKELLIRNESHVLSDDEPVFLNNPQVRRETIVVKDETGTIIYEENLDYFLLDRGSYIEIKRIPGGQIDEDETVYIDYVSDQVGAYRFNAHSHQFSSRISVFSGKLSVYYRFFDQDYSDVANVGTRILNVVSRNIWGAEFHHNYVSAGIELEDFNSNLIPYMLNRYHIGFNGKASQNVHFNLMSSLRDYRMTEESDSYSSFNLSGQLDYYVNMDLRLNVSGGYRNQSGNLRDLELSNLRTELHYLFRESRFVIGYEFYKRNFLSDKTLYNGGYVRYERTF